MHPEKNPDLDLNKRIILAGAGVVLVFVLFFFGKTATTKKEMPSMAKAETPQFNIKDTLTPTSNNCLPINCCTSPKLKTILAEAI